MPGMDGYEVCKRLKANSASRKIPVIFVTARDKVEDEAMGFKLGAVDYITKPVVPAIVTARVKTHLSLQNTQDRLREVLEKTLNGSIKLLSDLLAMADPVAHSRALRLKRYVNRIVEILELPNRWEFEMAAVLSQTGCIGLSSETLERIQLGLSVSEQEQALFDAHPEVGAGLIATIPHLGSVAAMIRGQKAPADPEQSALDIRDRDRKILGGNILKAVDRFDQKITEGVKPIDVVSRLRNLRRQFDPAVVDALTKVARDSGFTSAPMSIRVRSLSIGMVPLEDIVSTKGDLLLKKGSEVSDTILMGLMRYAMHQKVREPVRVMIPGKEQAA